MYFLAKTSFYVESANGTFIKRKEDIIVEDEAYVGVESVISSYYKNANLDEHKISSIKKLKIDALLGEKDSEDFSCKNWYKVILSFTTVNDKTGKEKNTLSYLFVNSESFESASETVNEYTKNWLVPTEINSISLSGVKDFIPMLKKEKPVEESASMIEIKFDGETNPSGYNVLFVD